MRTTLAAFVGHFILAGATWGQSVAKQDASAPLKNSTQKPNAPASAEFAVLDRFAGPWEVSETHFNALGDTVGSAKGTEEGAWVLDGRALQRTYTTGVQGNLFRAVGMIAWDAAEKQFEGAWFDNASTNGPTALTGNWDEAAKTMTFTLTSTGADGKPVQHKVIDQFLDDEHRVATTYKVLGGNQVEKIIEVQFKRARPCPANIGMIREGGKKD